MYIYIYIYLYIYLPQDVGFNLEKRAPQNHAPSNANDEWDSIYANDASDANDTNNYIVMYVM